MFISYKFRLKDKHAAELNMQAHAVNEVWNYCNEVQRWAVLNTRPWTTMRKLERLTAGSSKLLGLNSTTIQKVCQFYDKNRQGAKKAWLHFRSPKSLGWVPTGPGKNGVRFDGRAFVFRRKAYYPMHYRADLRPNMKLLSSSFNCDTRGRWYFNAQIEIQECAPEGEQAVGIDLGLDCFAALSSGEKICAPRFYRASEQPLALSQSAKKKKRSKAIHTKIRNRRADFLHKNSQHIADKFDLIIVGNINTSGLVKTNLAKSVMDAGWASFKRMLRYKSMRNGGRMIEVSEYMTSQTCSECGELPPSRPKGIAGLRNKMWTCDNCGTVHDRDVNAARNILAIGLDSLGGGAAKERSSQDTVLC